MNVVVKGCAFLDPGALGPPRARLCGYVNEHVRITLLHPSGSNSPALLLLSSLNQKGELKGGQSCLPYQRERGEMRGGVGEGWATPGKVEKMLVGKPGTQGFPWGINEDGQTAAHITARHRIGLEKLLMARSPFHRVSSFMWSQVSLEHFETSPLSCGSS